MYSLTRLYFLQQTDRVLYQYSMSLVKYIIPSFKNQIWNVLYLRNIWWKSAFTHFGNNFFRDYNELLLCLRLLKQHLPDDSALSPMGVKLTVELALISIKKEISSRIDKLEKLLETQSIMAVEESQNSLSVEEPQAQSEETTTKRRKVSLHYHGSQTVNSTACRKIFADIFKYLVNTNNLLLKILFFLINENVR